MERLREIYDQITECSRFVYRSTINLRPLLDSIIAEVNAARANLYGNGEGDKEKTHTETEDVFGNLINVPSDPKPECSNPDSVFLNNARLIKCANLLEGEIIPPQKEFLDGYKDLSFEEFCSYVFWRTSVRKGDLSKAIQSPCGYLYLYLSELVNFIEYDTVEETTQALYTLSSANFPEKQIQMISNATREFVTLYGSKQDAESCANLDYYDMLRRADTILKGDYRDALYYIADYSTKSIKGSAVYRDYEPLIRSAFPKALHIANEFLGHRGIPFLQLWIGVPQYFSAYLGYVRTIESSRVVDKTVAFGGIILTKVIGGNIEEVKRTSLGQDKDPGQCVFNRAYIMQSFYSVFERELRRLIGARSISLKTSDLWKMSKHSDVVKRIAEIFETEAFADCIRTAIIDAIEKQKGK